MVTMSEEELAEIPQAVDPTKADDDEVPLPAPLPFDAGAVDQQGMGALANAAAGKVEEEGAAAAAKRPVEAAAPDAGEPSPKKPRYAAAPAAAPTASDPAAAWESLMAQVRGHLRAMSNDECFSRALELQMLARSEVGSRSQHLSNAMDMMTAGQVQGAVAGVPPPAASPRAPVARVAMPLPRAAPVSAATAGVRVTKAEREVSKQKPIKTNKAAPVPCMKMTPPLPPRCEIDNAPNIELPAFCQLVNFPTARYYGNCVMCDESEFPIPKQNKGVCNNCDVAIWVVNPSGMNIKWCKGCKNFRKWIDFGVKGYSSKCEHCRQQQATRYANQKTKDSNLNSMLGAEQQHPPPSQVVQVPPSQIPPPPGPPAPLPVPAGIPPIAADPAGTAAAVATAAAAAAADAAQVNI